MNMDKNDVLYNIQEIITAICGENSMLSINDVEQIYENMKYSTDKIWMFIQEHHAEETLNQIAVKLQQWVDENPDTAVYMRSKVNNSVMNHETDFYIKVLPYDYMKTDNPWEENPVKEKLIKLLKDYKNVCITNFNFVEEDDSEYTKVIYGKNFKH